MTTPLAFRWQRRPIPLLFLGDAPTLPTGLARIGRDLAVQTSRLPHFRVGFLGRGGTYDRSLPFAQYNYQPTAESQWGDNILRAVWQNFAGDEPGIIMTLWDPSRLSPWFGHEFMAGHPVSIWGYFAVDGEGPGVDGALTGTIRHTLLQYDRVLAYSRFGERVLRATVPDHPDVDWIPHGINTTTFTPRDRDVSRSMLAGGFAGGLTDKHTLIGCVMSNQPRKNWGLWADMMRRVRKELEYPSVLRLWCHTDDVDRYWDMAALITDFGLADITCVTVDVPSDLVMSHRYSACNLTVLPSDGEGFGYPIVESLACGVPVMHGPAGAGSEWIPFEELVVPAGLINSRWDTRWNVSRPQWDAADWAEMTLDMIRSPYAEGDDRAGGERYRKAIEHLDWKKLWPSVWQKWMLRGIGA